MSITQGDRWPATNAECLGRANELAPADRLRDMRLTVEKLTASIERDLRASQRVGEITTGPDGIDRDAEGKEVVCVGGEWIVIGRTA